MPGVNVPGAAWGNKLLVFSLSLARPETSFHLTAKMINPSSAGVDAVEREKKHAGISSKRMLQPVKPEEDRSWSGSVRTEGLISLLFGRGRKTMAHAMSMLDYRVLVLGERESLAAVESLA